MLGRDKGGTCYPPPCKSLGLEPLSAIVTYRGPESCVSKFLPIFFKYFFLQKKVVYSYFLRILSLTWPRFSNRVGSELVFLQSHDHNEMHLTIVGSEMASRSFFIIILDSPCQQ